MPLITSQNGSIITIFLVSIESMHILANGFASLFKINILIYQIWGYGCNCMVLVWAKKNQKPWETQSNPKASYDNNKWYWYIDQSDFYGFLL